MNILLVGCGKMGSALLARWRELNLCDGIAIVEPSGTGHGDAPVFTSLDTLPQDFAPDAVVFAVKPQTLPGIAGDYARFKDALFISIAAGKPIAFFEKHLGASAHVVRAMPNTPAAIGAGMTVAYANAHVSARQKELAEKLLSAVGAFLWTDDEKLLNPVTALSGSGPAYVFLLIEAMTQGGIKTGLDPAMAEKLARQTVIGSALLAQAEKETPAGTLRKNVTSPGGTTAAALDVLMKDDAMQNLFDQALAAASKRAEELSG
jgi:pyrroline-5-carboxylate reductase